jgi:hypothetical protein
MQQSWRLDGDKLTFIVCKAEHVDGETEAAIATTRSRSSGREDNRKHDGALDESMMIGDVNLFISRVEWDHEDGDGDEGQGNADDKPKEATVGELELMIAVQTEQTKGYGKAALLAFLHYILSHEDEILREFNDLGHTIASPDTGTSTNVGVRRFDYLTVKIGEMNARSIGLFEGLGFRKTRETPSYFGEFELRLTREEMRRSFRLDTGIGSGCGIAYREVEYCCPLSQTANGTSA